MDHQPSYTFDSSSNAQEHDHDVHDQQYPYGLPTPMSSPPTLQAVDPTSMTRMDRPTVPRAGTPQWSEQLSMPLSPSSGSSRDAKQSRPPALAATHPSKYGSQTSPSSMPPPPPPQLLPMQSIKQTLLPPTKSFSGDHASQYSPPTDVPWRVYTDPMWQTSSDPHFWSVNRTVLKADSSTEVGNVVSPTWMVGLPFGSITEMAECYPSGERYDR